MSGCRSRPTPQVVPATLVDGRACLLIGFRRGGVLADIGGKVQWIPAVNVPPEYRKRLRLRDENVVLGVRDGRL